MAEQTGDERPAAMTGAAAEFATEALRVRKQAQSEYARPALEQLNKIAMDDKEGAIQVSALRELLEQVLGRPMPVLAIPAKQDEDLLAAIAANGAALREKLDRIAQAGTAATAADGAE